MVDEINQMIGKVHQLVKKITRKIFRRLTTAFASGELIDAKSAIVSPKIAYVHVISKRKKQMAMKKKAHFAGLSGSAMVALIPKVVRMIEDATIKGLSGWLLYLTSAILETIPNIIGHLLIVRISLA